MKHLPIILLFVSGCAELQRVLSIAQDTVSPIADTMYPGTGYVVGGVLTIATVITALVVKMRKRKGKLKKTRNY